jgi:hypothetical protein
VSIALSLLEHGFKGWLKHPRGSPDVKPGEGYWREEPQQKATHRRLATQD